MDNTKEYILCAAIKRLEPRQDSTMYYNNDICNIEIGYRHHDIIRRFQKEISRYPDDQGFYTSKGRFVGREEAMKIAWTAGQVETTDALKNTEPSNVMNMIELFIQNNSIWEEKHKNYFKKLYSENLY